MPSLTAIKAFRAARTVWTITEVVDTTMDAGNLADDLCRHFMGDNYDPQLRRTYQEVCDAGQAYDAVVKQVLDADADISNFLAGLQSLSYIQMDYDEKQKTIFIQLDKIDGLKKILATSIPTTYLWFTTIRTTANENRFDQNQLSRPTSTAPWWEYAMRGVFLPIEMYSVYDSYLEYKKKPTGDDANDSSRRRRRNAQADIFSGVDPASVRGLREVQIGKWQKVKAGMSKMGDFTTKGLKKVATLGSFAMNVYSIVNKVNRRQENLNELHGHLGRYQTHRLIYQYLLDGTGDDQTALEKVRSFFEIGAQDGPSREALQKGYNALKSDYRTDISKILNAMDDAYESMLGQFKKAASSGNTPAEQSDNVVKSLERSEAAFKSSVETIATITDQPDDQGASFRVIELSADRQSDTVKNTLDVIATQFQSSVANQLNIILTQLNIELVDHSAFNQLLTFARSVLDKEKEENQRIEELRRNENQRIEELREDLEDLKQLDAINPSDRLKTRIREKEQEINALLSNVEQQGSQNSAIEAIERELDRQATTAFDVFNASAPGRRKLTTQAEVKEALRRQVEELKKIPALRFDGIDDYIEISSDPFKNNAAFTITLWVKPSQLDNGWHGILGKQGDAHRKPGLWLAPDNKGLHYDSYGPASSSGSNQRFDGRLDSFFEAANQWVHIAWVKEGTEYKFYRNGELFATKPAPATFYTTQSSYWLGRVDNFFPGEMADVRFWDRARSQADIKADMGRRLQGNESGLAAYLPLTDKLGNRASDSTSGANHGTIHGAAVWNENSNLPIASSLPIASASRNN